MNSSVDATQYENTARNRSGYRDNQCQFGLECKLNAIDPHQPATCFGTSWASDPGADPVRQRKFYAMEFTGDQKLPPLIQADAYRDDEPQVVRFVEGDDVPARRRALENCMRQLGAARGRKLLLRCRQGELETQLGFARGWAEERRAWFPARPVVVGIDGIDQWLVSAPVAASQLQAIVNGGATVALFGVSAAHSWDHGDSRGGCPGPSVRIVRARAVLHAGSGERRICAACRSCPCAGYSCPSRAAQKSRRTGVAGFSA
jgi:hypothetical protein